MEVARSAPDPRRVESVKHRQSGGRARLKRKG